MRAHLGGSPRLWPILSIITIAASSACGDSSDTVGNDVASACVRSAACGIRAYPRVRECIANYGKENSANGGAFAPIFACVNRATDCTAVAACYGRGQSCGSDFKAFCDGETTVYCDLIDRRSYRLDCGAVGRTCAPDGSFGGGCGGSGPPPSTIPRLPSSTCPGGACEVVGGKCAADALDRCAGDALESCIEGRWVRFDCGALSLGACQPQPLGFGRCGRQS